MKKTKLFYKSDNIIVILKNFPSNNTNNQNDQNILLKFMQTPYVIIMNHVIRWHLRLVSISYKLHLIPCLSINSPELIHLHNIITLHKERSLFGIHSEHFLILPDQRVMIFT